MTPKNSAFALSSAALLLLLSFTSLEVPAQSSGSENAPKLAQRTSNSANGSTADEEILTAGKKAELQKEIDQDTDSIRFDPQNDLPYCARARSYLKLGAIDISEKDCEKAMEINPKNAETFFLLARIYAQRGKHREAQEHYSRAIEIDPLFGEAHFWRGQLQKTLGNQEAAKTDFSKSSELGFVINNEPDYSSYMSQLQSKIRRNWNPPRYSTPHSCTVRFNLFRDGRVERLKMYKSSGIQPVDDVALAAVKFSAPLSSLPPGAPPAVIINYSFDYKPFSGYKPIPSAYKVPPKTQTPAKTLPPASPSK